MSFLDPQGFIYKNVDIYKASQGFLYKNFDIY